MSILKSDIKHVKKSGESLILRLTPYFELMDLKLNDEVKIDLDENGILTVKKHNGYELTEDDVSSIAKFKDFVDKLPLNQQDKNEFYMRLNKVIGDSC
jgi:hypothetical protein